MCMTFMHRRAELEARRLREEEERKRLEEERRKKEEQEEADRKLAVSENLYKQLYSSLCLFKVKLDIPV